MRRTLVLTLVILVMFCSTIPTFASESTEMKMYEYDVNGVRIMSSDPFTQEEAVEMYEYIISESNKSNSIDFGTRVVQPDLDGAETLYGPKYNHYTNSEVNVTTLVLFNWAAEYFSFNTAKAKLIKAALATALSQFLSYVVSDDTYAGAWITQKWSDYYDCHIQYQTLVHYTDATYSTPTDVVFVELNREYN